jgi:hypothetical protein
MPLALLFVIEIIGTTCAFTLANNMRKKKNAINLFI